MVLLAAVGVEAALRRLRRREPECVGPHHAWLDFTLSSGVNKGLRKGTCRG